MNQTSLFEYPDVNLKNEQELVAYITQAMMDHMGGICGNRDITVKEGLTHTSIMLRGTTVCRVCSRATKRTAKRYIAVYGTRLPESVQPLRLPMQKADSGYVRLSIDNIECFSAALDAVLAALDDIVLQLPPLFSCCSYYASCSDARKCVNPAQEMALACSYCRKLAQGTIYYGKNRNIV